MRMTSRENSWYSRTDRSSWSRSGLFWSPSEIFCFLTSRNSRFPSLKLIFLQLFLPVELRALNTWCSTGLGADDRSDGCERRMSVGIDGGGLVGGAKSSFRSPVGRSEQSPKGEEKGVNVKNEATVWSIFVIENTRAHARPLGWCPGGCVTG